MDELESVLADLKTGAVDSTGRFTLNSSRARERLREYQLADPHRFVLLLVASAVAGGATSIQIGASVGGLALVHDGQVLSQDDLLGLLSSPFVSGTRADLRLLALGVNSALSLEVTSLVIQSWRDGQGWAARFEGEEPRLTPLKDRPASLTTLEVHYRRRRLQEVAALLLHECPLCPADLEVNGIACSQPVDFGPCLALRQITSTREEPALRLRVRLDPEALLSEQEHSAGFSALLALGCAPGPELTLVVLGRSFIRELPWELHGWGLRVVVATDRVRLDLSQSELVEDQVLENLQKALWKEALKMVSDLAARCESLPPHRLRQALPALEFLLDSECANGAWNAAAQLCARLRAAYGVSWEAAAFLHKYSLIAQKAGDLTLCGRLQTLTRELWLQPASQSEYRLPDGHVLEARSYQRWLRIRAEESVLGRGHPSSVHDLEACVGEAVGRRRYREAVYFLRWLIEHHEGLVERWIALAENLAHLALWEEAREAWRQALAACPRSRLRDLVAIFDGLAQVEVQRGDLAEAVDLLEGCVALQVELEGQRSARLHPLLMRLSELLLARGNGQRATELRAWAGMLPQR